MKDEKGEPRSSSFIPPPSSLSLQAAEQIYRQILQSDPANPDALHQLGVIAHQAGRHEVAADFFERAIAVQPGVAAYHSNLGEAYRCLGRLEKAADCYRQALRLKADYPEALNNLGLVLQKQGQPALAAECCQRAVTLAPAFALAHNNLGNALRDQGQNAAALACYRRALELNPDYAEAHSNLGNLLSDREQAAGAIACYRRALQLKPNFVEAYVNLAHALLGVGQIAQAIATCQQALQHNAACPEAYLNLGNALKAQGQADDAITCYQKSLQFKPEYRAALSNLLDTLPYCDGITLAQLAAAHAEYERRYASPLRAAWQPHLNRPDVDRALRVGFVSPDLCRHPVGFFLIGVLEHLDRGEVELICYNDRVAADDFTDRFRGASGLWRDVFGQSDAQLAQQIRADAVDVLFDLAGHTAHNRLLVFARKPAPIQLTWAGYMGTTGLSAIDYILADRYEIPVEFEQHYREKVLRLPDGYVGYQPPADAPPVGPLPAEAAGHVTFGSFNNPAKITPEVVALWSEVLREVPASRLLLKFRGLNDPGAQDRYRRLFAAQAIGADRVELEGWSPHRELLARYNRIDVALDTFPYSGGLTTCEALWMGVPVVTCPGETFASRHSLSHLSSVGLTETIAQDRRQYVQLAAGLAADLPRLSALRAGLRDRVAQSPLCDASRLAGQLTALLRDVWRQWCREASPNRVI